MCRTAVETEQRCLSRSAAPEKRIASVEDNHNHDSGHFLLVSVVHGDSHFLRLVRRKNISTGHCTLQTFDAADTLNDAIMSSGSCFPVQNTYPTPSIRLSPAQATSFELGSGFCQGHRLRTCAACARHYSLATVDHRVLTNGSLECEGCSQTVETQAPRTTWRHPRLRRDVLARDADAPSCDGT